MESHLSVIYIYFGRGSARRALFPPYSLVNAARVENCRLGRANLVSRVSRAICLALDDFSQ
jgi:hypothetical protein